MSRYFLIAGEDKYNDLIWNTLRIEQNLTYIMNTCKFQIRHYRPIEGEEIIIEDDSIGRLFAGIIVKVELAKSFPVNQVVKVWQVECNDYTELVDRKLVVEAYENKTADEIFLDIAIKYCPDFNTDNIRPGAPVVESTGIEFEYKRPSECFKWLCDYCGWHWYPDYYKGLHFFSAEELSSPAPIEITPGGNFNFGKYGIDKQGLRNRVYVRGGTMLSDPQLVQWKADGIERIWVLPWPPHDIGFKVGEISKSVGVENLHDEAEFDYMMSFAEKYIRCSEQTATPIAGETMTLTAKQDIPVITMVEDYKSQQAIAKIQKGSDGIYEHIITDDSLTTIAAAEAAGLADLREHANPRVRGDFKIGHSRGEGVFQDVWGFDIDESYFLKRDVLVTDSNSRLYKLAGTPYPPLGGVFPRITKKGLPIGGLDACSACWFILSLLKIYDEKEKSFLLLPRAKLVANFIKDHLTIQARLGDTSFVLVSDKMEFNQIKGWEKAVEEVHVKTQYLVLWALLELYDVTGDNSYLPLIKELIQTCGFVYNKVNQLVSDASANWMIGALFNSFIFNFATSHYEFSTSFFSTMQTGLFMYYSITKYIELFGNITLKDHAGENFTPQSILDGFGSWAEDCYNNHDLKMSNGGIYQFYHYTPDNPFWFLYQGLQIDQGPLLNKQYNYNDPVSEFFNDFLGPCEYFNTVNKSPEGPVYGDLEWSMDLQLNGVLGFGLHGEHQIANDLRSFILSKKVPNIDDLLFYNTYNFDGSPFGTETRNISVSLTGLLRLSDQILGITEREQEILNTLQKYQMNDGGFTVNNSPNSNTGSGETGEIFYSSVLILETKEVKIQWRPGQIVNIRLPDYEVEGKFLIQRVTVVPLTPDSWDFHIEYGGRLLGIADYLQALVSAQQKKRHLEPAQSVQKFVYSEDKLALRDQLFTTTRQLPYGCGDEDAECGMVVM